MPEDFFRKQYPQTAEPAGNKVDTFVFECDRRFFRIDRYLLEGKDLADALLISDEPVLSAALLFPQPSGQFFGCDFRRDEDELTDQPRIFQRRRSEQSRNAGEQNLFLIIGNDDMDEHFA